MATPSGGRPYWLAPVACVVAVPIAVLFVLAVGHDPVQAEANQPLHARDKDYVGASACKSCHEDHWASWRRTFHSTMTQLPTEESVLGRFNGDPVTLFGATATPFQHDGRYFFRLPAIGNDGTREAEVAFTVGSRRYQQYFERREGVDGVTYRRLPLLWHVGESRWMHLNGAFLEPDSNDWSTHQGVWNANCVFCHNTGIAPGLRDTSGDAPGKRFDTHVSDLGIACESCHGPGKKHVERHGSIVERYLSMLGLEKTRDIAHPMRLAQKETMALCGQCHSQRLPNEPEKIWTYLDQGPEFRPGERLEAHVTPVTRETPSLDPQNPELFRQRFWGDGTARLTAYEYLGVTQSPCFQGGKYSCRSCHRMHSGDVNGQLEPEMRGDRACTQCHDGIGKNVRAHTHHAVESSGSRCLDCHMPRITYGILAIHRSHRVESPDVRRDVEAGRPNACTACHADKTALWAADRMKDFWGPRYERPAARADRAPLDVPEALASLHAGDPVLRAATVSAIGRADGAVPPRERGFLLANTLVTLGDGYGAVRHLARLSAIGLDRSLGLRLYPRLQAFDTQAPPEQRDQALTELFLGLQTNARGRLPPPPDATFLSNDYQLDLERIRALLGLQTAQAISVGE
jgi:predicted CXXCH cytochrome family protein